MTLLRKVERLQLDLVDERRQAPGLFGEVTRAESMLAETYRNRVQYELLQNSDDAEARTVTIRTTTHGRFTWENDGRTMTGDDVIGLCRSVSSVKQRGQGTIGYRGIGFKSLAAIATKVTVTSAGVEFDFDRAATAGLIGAVSHDDVPLIRIPSAVRRTEPSPGARFLVQHDRPFVDLTIDPTAMLFLRNVEQVHGYGAGTSTLRVRRSDGYVTIETEAGSAQFATLDAGTAKIAFPLTPAARAMTGPTGRLACFLPLDETIGLPMVISGDLTTDPSRTHAIVDDQNTHQVLSDAAGALAAILVNPRAPLFNDLWHLLLQAEDPRAVMMGATRTPSSAFLALLRAELKNAPPPFALFPVPLTASDLRVVFPSGAPLALYQSENRTAVRALRSALGLPEFAVEKVAERIDPQQLSLAVREALDAQFRDHARVHVRALTDAEQAFTPPATSGPSRPEVPAAGTPGAGVPAVRRAPLGRDQEVSLPSVIARWRVAERAVVEWLNARGWKLEDVSKQNLGYDAAGLDADGQLVCLEIKKVDRPDSPFAMTTNEWALMQSGNEPVLIAILIGDEHRSRLVLFDPVSADVRPERVIRQWEWRFENWAQFSTPLL